MNFGDSCVFCVFEEAEGVMRLTIATGKYLSRDSTHTYIAFKQEHTVKVKNEHVFKNTRELSGYMSKWFAEIYYKDNNNPVWTWKTLFSK